MGNSSWKELQGNARSSWELPGPKKAERFFWAMNGDTISRKEQGATGSCRKLGATWSCKELQGAVRSLKEL
jgi:hypothetical protein